MQAQDQVLELPPPGWPARLLAGPWHCGCLSCRGWLLVPPWLRVLGQEVLPSQPPLQGHAAAGSRWEPEHLRLNHLELKTLGSSWDARVSSPDLLFNPFQPSKKVYVFPLAKKKKNQDITFLLYIIVWQRGLQLRIKATSCKMKTREMRLSLLPDKQDVETQE